MVDLRKKPFYLSEEDIRWVTETVDKMTEEEKAGQLFVHMVGDRSEEGLIRLVEKYHVGGIRYQNADPLTIYEQNRILQENSKLPLLIAANCEAGGNGCVDGGTAVANGAAIAAGGLEEMAYQMGKIGAAEAKAVGCNWNFAPVADLTYNWRNTVVQLRAFNDNPDDVIRYMRSFRKGAESQGIATCVKHFPGDGTEENDQHLLMGVNNMSCEEWDASYGRVYKAAIEDGVLSIMAGHIALPAYSKRLCPGMRDQDVRPATLSHELITGLLREKLGFNGLVITDASHMIGMFGSCVPRREQVPAAIAAGCDMFLFFNDIEEDFGYMLEGCRNGVITKERLQDALYRILGMKAKLKLPLNRGVGRKEDLAVIGCKEHKETAKRAADRFVTLVKDVGNYLPMTVERYKRLKLIFISGEGQVVAGQLMPDKTHEVKKRLVRLLEEKGFAVDAQEMDKKGKTEEFRAKYDACLVVLDVIGFAQSNSLRVRWKLPAYQPWYVSEVPTIFLSLNLTNHLVDVPMAKTYVNAYLDSQEAMEAAVEKLMGKSPFHGKYHENVFCGRWDTRR